MSDGATLDEAMANLADARELYLSMLIEDGEPIPAPDMNDE
jgi:predicted RNase H-like HicB family nuclease